MRFLSGIDWPLRAALLIAIPVMLIVATLTYGGHALESIEHSFFDWRTALLGTRLNGPHPGGSAKKTQKADGTVEASVMKLPQIADIVTDEDKSWKV